MDYSNHLTRAINLYGSPQIKIQDPGEQCVVLLRTNGLTYSQIQKWMGNPPKKWIRNVLLKHRPELIEKDCNYHKLESNKIDRSIERQLISLCFKHQKWNWTEFNFIMKDKELFIVDEKHIDKVVDYDIVCQTQILNSIKNEC